MNQIHIDPARVLDLIRKLNVNKSHGHDGISARMLKLYDDTMVIPLTIVFKKCIAQGYFPKRWKKANIVPTHKKKQKNLIQNYRPISLLPLCGKIFEKIIYDNLYPYIFNNNFISDKQSGYRRNDSTVKQLISITHEIYKTFDANKELRAVFLDISRAFDRVWHEGLLFKLRRIGIEGEALKIIESFLSDREQRVVLNGQFSEWAPVEAGVPQGSILGPLLFLVYINDLVEVVHCDIRIFADDTFIFRIVDATCTQELNDDLERIAVWAHQWKMLFNPDISKQAVEVIFSRKRDKSILAPLTFNNIPVAQVDETIHLGMTLDSRLTFSTHLENKLAKARQGIGVMKQLKKWVSYYVLEVVYKLYVRPHLEYGDVVFHTGNPNKAGVMELFSANDDLKKVESIQYNAARVVTGAWKGSSRKDLYENLGWESLNNRRIMRKLCLLHETINNKFPTYLHTIVRESSYRDGHRLEAQKMLVNIPCNKRVYKASFFPSTISDWNKLDVGIKSSQSKSIFKNKMLSKIRPKKRSFFGLRDNSGVRFLTMLRMDLSPLRAHKFKYKFPGITHDKCDVCECVENTDHYLLKCLSYRLARATMLENISRIINVQMSTLPQIRVRTILLYGKDDVDDDKNLKILKEVVKYIVKSKRLDTI
jgi:hypothetical protein